MKSPENFQVISKQYPIFIEAASSIADILHKLDSTKARAPEFEDSESSSSSSSSEDLTANNNNNNNDTYNAGGSSRPITQQQLAEALAYVAGAAFRSSQQSLSTESREPMELTTDQGETQDTAVTGRSNNATAANEQVVEQGRTREDSYTQELIQMREMGLTDEGVNLQALLICNGDLEAAINLVFSSSS